MTRKQGIPRASRNANPRRSGRKPSVLDRLGAGESQAVLSDLLAAHPDLRPEAERLALSFVSDFDFEAVADDVEHELRRLDIDDLNDRTGSHRDGYTHPTDAAWELLQEVVDPFLADMSRHLELRLDEAALQMCKGIVLGLYRVRRQARDGVLGWAPDFRRRPPSRQSVRSPNWTPRGEPGLPRDRASRWRSSTSTHRNGARTLHAARNAGERPPVGRTGHAGVEQAGGATLRGRVSSRGSRIVQASSTREGPGPSPPSPRSRSSAASGVRSPPSLA